MQSLPRKHHAGLHQLFIKLAHLGEQSLARHHARLRVLGGFDQNHESHRRSPSVFEPANLTFGRAALGLKSIGPPQNRQPVNLHVAR